MHGAAVLLGLAAAGCLYAAAPNQLLLPPAVGGASPVSRCGARWLSVMAVLLAALAMQHWSPVLGGPGAVAGTLLVLTGGLSLWPLLGALAHGRRTRPGRSHP
ncbi:hypothetical protein ACQUJS_05480 [Ralstonia pseudosolanacearum]|uniref:Lipoprotein transmembrane n=1 Tax=Ralstonia solanacearum TaxID=305 RepID=A0A0S4TTZ4_RALSL|nr:hypothetical protein [Ralstonia pseudosolanacearum]OAI75813.1 lipoprotein [Ralstonia solanacearum]QCX51560.1 hypothetical protein E7Z57_21250 [Ralstonia pseudosolanacearum]CUV13538.1 conserved membrane protein of unknown function [Ralstonia solanacearum]